MAGSSVLRLDAATTVPDPTPDPGAPMPTANAAGWWDASALSWGSTPGGLVDKSAAGKNAGTSAKAIPRLAGTLGGMYAEGSTSTYNVLHPVITDYSVSANAISVGVGQAFSVMLTWSRPNQRQPNQGALSAESVSLLAIDGTQVLMMTGRGDGTDTLVLFPGTTAITGGVLGLRHTHAVRVVFAGASADVWLDGIKVISAAVNQITLASTANLTFLSSAHCIFHEAAAWSKSLSGAEHSALTGYLARWPLGPRRAANGIIIGQSNAGNLLESFVFWPLINKAVAYLTGCIASNILWRNGNNGNLGGGSTIFSGQGLYDTGGGLCLNSSTGAANVATWPLGNNGNTYMAAIDSMSADQLANLRYVFWYWSETDSNTLTYADKATYLGAMKRFFSLLRARTGLTAAQLPIMVINALPFPGEQGNQAHREVMADLVADASQNCHMMLAQSNDAIGQGDSWDSGTGLESGGGNAAHRDFSGVLDYNRRWPAPIARAVLAANAAAATPDAVTTIDVSIPRVGGPAIADAHHEGGTSVLVTLAHDGGDDLVVPLRAALGVGWVLMDGVSASVAGTPGAPGSLILATACVRVSATQVRLTMASAPAFPGMAKIYYVYGSGLDANGFAVIGRGNAVTDNFSTVTLAAGWRIGADRGAAEQPNNPLQATTYGVALT